MNIAFHTLGCKLNFSETSFIANNMQDAGFNQVAFNEFSDIYVINTCSVTENANKECQYLIRKVLSINPNAKTVIMGCYAQLKPKEIAKIKGVDLILGNNDKFELKQFLNTVQKNNKPQIIKRNIEELNSFKSSFSSGTRTRSFLKVQDGCNYKCTFCTIPLARGKSRSDTVENVIQKIKKLKKDGIKEIVLTGINLGDFKTENNERFLDLLIQIDKIKNIRVRISSIEPNLINDKIIDLVSKSKTILPHFHIPLQSGSDVILKAMKRRYLTKHYKQVVEEINHKIPNACIGVDVIVGFPGETDKYFNETVLFLKSINISYLHVFSYSERENTEAINMKQQVPVEIKKYRSKVLRNLSDKKRQAFYQNNIGLTKEVLFENQTKNGYIYGFSENYIKIKSTYKPNLENTIKNVIINKIEHNNMTYAKGLLINQLQ
tara:strand:+ start:322 stop:1623 length:1302 start_codon:yes stop_codon:yes gene_type:complete